jgi:hypothetical protein
MYRNQPLVPPFRPKGQFLDLFCLYLFMSLWPEAACKKSRFISNGDYEILVECRIDLLLKKLNENADFSSGH